MTVMSDDNDNVSGDDHFGLNQNCQYLTSEARNDDKFVSIANSDT